jgi:hypothetical protein
LIAGGSVIEAIYDKVFVDNDTEFVIELCVYGIIDIVLSAAVIL